MATVRPEIESDRDWQLRNTIRTLMTWRGITKLRLGEAIVDVGHGRPVERPRVGEELTRERHDPRRAATIHAHELAAVADLLGVSVDALFEPIPASTF